MTNKKSKFCLECGSLLPQEEESEWCNNQCATAWEQKFNTKNQTEITRENTGNENCLEEGIS